jgi:uncharacterized spore protein YtfJ
LCSIAIGRSSAAAAADSDFGSGSAAAVTVRAFAVIVFLWLESNKAIEVEDGSAAYSVVQAGEEQDEFCW